MNDPGERPDPRRWIRDVLSRPDDQPWIEPSADLARRVAGRIRRPAAAGEDERIVRVRPASVLMLAAAVLLAAGALLVMTRRPARSPSPAAQLAGLLEAIPGERAIGLPERAMAAEWEAIAADARAAANALGACLPR